MEENKFSPERIEELREKAAPLIGKRLKHTLGVERAVISLGSIYLPEKIPPLRVAAILHDLTKYYSVEEHLEVFRRNGFTPDENILAAPKCMHSVSGSFVAREKFADYVDEEILTAIRWHTTGHRGMTMFESLLYLADYIEDTRTFVDCVTLRDYYETNLVHCCGEKERLIHLEKTM
ncbi:MAG: bis(5'-nucleosyl)-tetraphosphatase (symmetrical) YqeK, partial [Clostridia bacterium]|nr:bis(5'-nucleosyl)-tetraphosphatase (symmetrical) YqeK [Clostridia bacterium]